MQHLLLALLLVPAAACATDDSPTITMHVVQNGIVANEPPSQSLLVTLQRPYGHTWTTPPTATLNGADVGALTLSDGDAGETFRDPEVPASASFRVPMTSIVRSVHVEMTEGSEHFVVEVPDFNAPRTITVHTPVDELTADGSIEVDSGVATDVLDGGFHVEAGGAFCFTQWGATRTATTIAFKLPPAGTFDDCVADVGTTNAPGSTRSVELSISLWSVTPTTRCDGPDLTCAPVLAPTVDKVMPATLQF